MFSPIQEIKVCETNGIKSVSAKVVFQSNQERMVRINYLGLFFAVTVISDAYYVSGCPQMKNMSSYAQSMLKAIRPTSPFAGTLNLPM